MIKTATFFLLLLLAVSLSAKDRHSNELPIVEPENLPVMELSSACKTLYPDRMGLSPNESLLSLFQTILGLMSINDGGLSEKVSLSVDNETHIFDVDAVLRRIRVMDVDRIEIVNNPDAKSGTSGQGVSVRVLLKRNRDGFHGNVALDCNTNGTIDPTMNFGWKKGRWSISGGASFYFDRSKTFTIEQSTQTEDGELIESRSEEDEKERTYGESASLRVRCNISEKDNISLSVTQDYLKVKTWTNTQINTRLDSTMKEGYSDEKQNSNSIRLGYGHHFANQMDLSVSLSAKFQNNPHLYSYHHFGIKKKNGFENTSSSTKRFYANITQTFPLWKNAKLTIGERFENGLINDLTKVKLGDASAYYDIISINSQTKAQIDWNVANWTLELGEVIDYFHYDIAVTTLSDKTNNTTSPQSYVSVGCKITPKHIVHASYRTGVTRPNYKQIYPVVSSMDANNNPMLIDSLFRHLDDSKMHTFNVGYVFNGNTLSLSSNFKTIVINDKLTKVDKVWMNSEKNNIYRFYSTLVWTPCAFSTALSASVNLLRYRNKEMDDYTNKVGFDVRWMGVYNLKRGWSVGANVQYNGPVWDAYCKIDHFVYADAHVTKTLRNWSFNACMNDIFDMRIKRTKMTTDMMEVISEDRDYRGLSLGVSYKF